MNKKLRRYGFYAASPVQRQRTQLTVQEKHEIVKFKDDNPQLKTEEIAAHFLQRWGKPIAQRTLRLIFQKRSKWEQGIKNKGFSRRTRTAKHADMEAALYSWIVKIESQQVNTTDEMIISKAKEIGHAQGILDFGYSNGWLFRFKGRHFKGGSWT